MAYNDPIKRREYQREYQRSWIARRRAEWMMGKVCAICGTCENLEIDHIIPLEKEHNITWSWSMPRLLEELSKCQILCNIHHMEKTIAYRKSMMSHGTRGMYTTGCRCVDCTFSNKMYKRKMSAKQKME